VTEQLGVAPLHTTEFFTGHQVMTIVSFVGGRHEAEKTLQFREVSLSSLPYFIPPQSNGTSIHFSPRITPMKCFLRSEIHPSR